MFSFPALLRGRNRANDNPAIEEQESFSPRATLVALTLDPRDRQLLADLGGENGWKIHVTGDLDEAGSMVHRLRAPVALCDREAPDGNWRSAVRALASPGHEPCVIVCAKRVDDYLWEEVIRNRGYDILAKPLREYEVTRIVGLALSFWNSRASGDRMFRR